MGLYFASDPHLGHRAVLQKRGFKTTFGMTEAFVANWNATVRPADTVWLLGDVALCLTPSQIIAAISRLNGQIYLIAGNHDDVILQSPACRALFKDILSEYCFQYQGQAIVLHHCPWRDWYGMQEGSWMLHGHSHGKCKNQSFLRRLDLSVDHCLKWVVSFEEIARYMRTKTVGYWRNDIFYPAKVQPDDSHQDALFPFGTLAALGRCPGSLAHVGRGHAGAAIGPALLPD